MDGARARERLKARIECEYCHGLYDSRNHGKWHGENCLANPNVNMHNRKQPPRSDEYRKKIGDRCRGKRLNYSDEERKIRSDRMKAIYNALSDDEKKARMDHMRASKQNQL